MHQDGAAFAAAVMAPQQPWGALFPYGMVRDANGSLPFPARLCHQLWYHQTPPRQTAPHTPKTTPVHPASPSTKRQHLRMQVPSITHQDDAIEAFHCQLLYPGMWPCPHHGHAASAPGHCEQDGGRENTALSVDHDSGTSAEQLRKLKPQCCTSCVNLHSRSFISSKAGSSRRRANYN